jgi:hypothetical protein
VSEEGRGEGKGGLDGTKVLFKPLYLSIIWREKGGYISKQNFNGASDFATTRNRVERGHKGARCGCALFAVWYAGNELYCLSFVSKWMGGWIVYPRLT